MEAFGAMQMRQRLFAIGATVAVAGGVFLVVSSGSAQESPQPTLKDVEGQIADVQAQMKSRFVEMSVDGYTPEELAERDSLINHLWELRVEEEHLGGGTD